MMPNLQRALSIAQWQCGTEAVRAYAEAIAHERGCTACGGGDLRLADWIDLLVAWDDAHAPPDRRRRRRVLPLVFDVLSGVAAGDGVPRATLRVVR